MLKRFVTEDPIGIDGGINLYSYVGASPTLYVDPTGKFGLPGAFGGAAFNVALQIAANYPEMGFVGALNCVNLSSVGVSFVAGFFFPGAVSAGWKSIKVITRGASAMRAGASVILTAMVQTPLTLVTASQLPQVPVSSFLPPQVVGPVDPALGHISDIIGP